MKSILILSYPFTGPINSSFQIAKLLSVEGYRIVYIVPFRYKEKIEAQGFCFDTLDESDDFLPGDHLHSLKNYSQLLGDIKDSKSEFFRRVERLVRKYQPVCLLVDSDLPAIAVALSGLKIKILMVSELILSEKTAYVPPFSSSYIPGRSWWSYLRVEFEWLKCFLRKRIYYLSHVIGSRGRSDIYYKRVARVVGFDLKKNANYKRSWLYGLKNYPEFFLYPSEFDFPRKTIEKNQYFIGPLIDVERHEEPFSWENISDTVPLVYCALGTLSQVYYPEYGSFLNKLISIFEKQPGFNLILSAGDKMEELKTKAKNIYIYKRVPQLQVLKRASIMITHAGLNSVKECIHFGVPMLAYPIGMQTDQPGNAARVVFHGLGRRGDIRRDSAEKIMTDFLEVYKNPYYRKNIVNMQKVFHQYKNDEHSTLKFIESFIETSSL